MSARGVHHVTSIVSRTAQPGWSGGDVQPCLHGLLGVTLSVQDAGRAGSILSDTLGFREAGRDGAYRKLAAHRGHGG